MSLIAPIPRLGINNIVKICWIFKKSFYCPVDDITDAMGVRKKFVLEYPLNAGPEFLYTYISTASGLATWFADDVNINGDTFSFMWEGSSEKAKLVNKRTNKYVKFQWMDRDPDEYFTFEIDQDELTGDVALIISDYENEEDIKGATMIYNVSIDRLKGTIGG